MSPNAQTANGSLAETLRSAQDAKADSMWVNNVIRANPDLQFFLKWQISKGKRRHKLKKRLPELT